MKTLGNIKDLVNYIKDPNNSKLYIILGSLGSGKTVLSFRIDEVSNRDKCYVINVSTDNLPDKFIKAKNLRSITPNSNVIIDDASMIFNTEYHKNINKLITYMIRVSRHKNINYIFNMQNTGGLNRRIVELVNGAIFIKEPSLTDMERDVMKKFIRDAREYFDGIPVKERKKYSYVVSNVYIGGIKNRPPVWWNDAVSRNKL